MDRSLVIGFGNVFRRDDGVAFVVVNALRAHLGRPPLSFDDDGFDDLGHTVDTMLVHQLVPELTDVVAGYDQVVFVDAHVGAIEALVYEEELDVCPKTVTVSHQLHPCSLLALIQELHGQAPRGVLISIRGYDFDFGERLSAETAALVPQAVARIEALTGSGNRTGMGV